jgi:hypothetical protein
MRSRGTCTLDVAESRLPKLDPGSFRAIVA